MLEVQVLPAPRKSEMRTAIVDTIVACLRHEQIYKTLDYRNKSEQYLKQYMHQPLQRTMVEVFRRIDGRLSEAALQKKAASALLWEGDVTTTINNIRFLGVQHRPDFVVKAADLRIAVEVKMGESGGNVREGIGQALVYAGSREFDFVIYLFIDTSKDKKVRESLSTPAAASFVASLWQHYNVRFSVV